MDRKLLVSIAFIAIVVLGLTAFSFAANLFNTPTASYPACVVYETPNAPAQLYLYASATGVLVQQGVLVQVAPGAYQSSTLYNHPFAAWVTSAPISSSSQLTQAEYSFSLSDGCYAATVTALSNT